MTKDNWIKAFDEQFSFIGGCIDRDTLANYLTIKKYGTEHLQDIKAFISQVEKDAIERGYKEGWDDGYVSGLEKPEYINECKNKVKDAIEKTNKRWEQAIKLTGEDEDVHITYSCNVCGGVGEFMTKLRKNLSDLRSFERDKNV